MNKYQSLVKKKGQFCKGKVTKSAVKKAASLYVKSAGKGLTGKAKAKAVKSARTSANRVLNRGCKISSVVAGRKKKKK